EYEAQAAAAAADSSGEAESSDSAAAAAPRPAPHTANEQKDSELQAAHVEDELSAESNSESEDLVQPDLHAPATSSSPVARHTRASLRARGFQPDGSPVVPSAQAHMAISAVQLMQTDGDRMLGDTDGIAYAVAQGVDVLSASQGPPQTY